MDVEATKPNGYGILHMHHQIQVLAKIIRIYNALERFFVDDSLLSELRLVVRLVIKLVKN